MLSQTASTVGSPGIISSIQCGLWCLSGVTHTVFDAAHNLGSIPISAASWVSATSSLRRWGGLPQVSGLSLHFFSHIEAPAMSAQQVPTGASACGPPCHGHWRPCQDTDDLGFLCRPPHASRPLPFLPRKPTTGQRSAQTCGSSPPKSGRFEAQTSPSRQCTRRLWGSCTLTAESHSGQGLLHCIEVAHVSAWHAAAPCWTGVLARSWPSARSPPSI